MNDMNDMNDMNACCRLATAVSTLANPRCARRRARPRLQHTQCVGFKQLVADTYPSLERAHPWARHLTDRQPIVTNAIPS
jgi:hypothetical protein